MKCLISRVLSALSIIAQVPRLADFNEQQKERREEGKGKRKKKRGRKAVRRKRVTNGSLLSKNDMEGALIFIFYHYNFLKEKDNALK